MTIKEKKKLFKKALLEAEKNGYKDHLDMFPAFIHPKNINNKFLFQVLFSQKEKILISHKFCKALFGKGLVFGGRFSYRWQVDLIDMILQKEPFEYLKDYFIRQKARKKRKEPSMMTKEDFKNMTKSAEDMDSVDEFKHFASGLLDEIKSKKG